MVAPKKSPLSGAAAKAAALLRKANREAKALKEGKPVYKIVGPAALRSMKQAKPLPPKPKDNHYTNNLASAGIQPPKKKYVKVMTPEENKEWAINRRMRVRAQQAKRKPRVSEQGN